MSARERPRASDKAICDLGAGDADNLSVSVLLLLPSNKGICV
jgi:hypothetical protein